MLKRIVLTTVLLIAFVGCEQNAPAPTTEAPKAEKEEAATPTDGKEAEKTDDNKEEPKTGAASSAEAKPEFPSDMKKGDKQFFGAKFTVIEPPIALKEAIAKGAGDYKVSANVEKVCKKKGCWFTLTADGIDKPVRVRMKDYGFFVPKNSETAKAVVEGSLKEREIPQDEAQHYADESGSKEKVEGPQKTWEFTATAVELELI